MEAINRVRKQFPVMNPSASLKDIQRHVCGEQEQFACVGGHKYFYVDWDLNIWRCEAWSKPLGSVFDLDRIQDSRDRCTACMMACYRDTSVMMHAGIAAEDAMAAAGSERLGKAARLLFRKTVLSSMGTVIAQAPQILSLGGRSNRRKKHSLSSFKRRGSAKESANGEALKRADD